MKTSPALASFDDFGNWIPGLPSEERRPPLVFAETPKPLPPRDFPIEAGDLACIQGRHISLASVLYAPGSAGFEAGVAFYVYCAFSGAHLFTAKIFRYGVSGGRLRRLPDLVEPSEGFSGPGVKSFVEAFLTEIGDERPLRKFRVICASLALEALTAWTTATKPQRF